MMRTYKGWIIEKSPTINAYEAHKKGVRVICNDYDGLLNSIRRRENIPCKWLYDEVCVNDESDYCADFPDKEYCTRCRFYESEDK